MAAVRPSLEEEPVAPVPVVAPIPVPAGPVHSSKRKPLLEWEESVPVAEGGKPGQLRKVYVYDPDDARLLHRIDKSYNVCYHGDENDPSYESFPEIPAVRGQELLRTALAAVVAR